MSDSTSYDLIVIGAGPAGYPCAIRAAQNGLTVACIDEWKNYDGSHAFGGTCLNAGCIPSKALLESTELFHRAQTGFSAHGIKVGELGFDVEELELVADDDGYRLHLTPRVVEPGHHRRETAPGL